MDGVIRSEGMVDEARIGVATELNPSETGEDDGAANEGSALAEGDSVTGIAVERPGALLLGTTALVDGSGACEVSTGGWEVTGAAADVASNGLVDITRCDVSDTTSEGVTATLLCFDCSAGEDDGSNRATLEDGTVLELDPSVTITDDCSTWELCRSIAEVDCASAEEGTTITELSAGVDATGKDCWAASEVTLVSFVHGEALLIRLYTNCSWLKPC